MTRVSVVGDGPLAVGLRRRLPEHGCTVAGAGDPLDALVVVGEASPVHRPIEEYTDEDFDDAWERPVLGAVDAMLTARRRGARRMVLVIGTHAMTGSAGDAPNAMAAEGLHALAKSAARQWGSEGITVNAVVVPPAAVGALGDAVSLAPVALGPADDEAASVAPTIAYCCSGAAGRLTGSTLVVDGGSWMP